jgi:hypothetical protein
MQDLQLILVIRAPEEKAMKTPPSPPPQQQIASAAVRSGPTGVLFWTALLSVYMYIHGL